MLVCSTILSLSKKRLQRFDAPERKSVHKWQHEDVVIGCGAGQKSGGGKETRTPDPLLAKQVLYQLSYTPARG